MTPNVPAVPTQIVAFVAAVLAWIDPGHQLPNSAQGIIVAALALVIAIIHGVQAYHRVNYTPPTPALPAPPAGSIPPPAPQVGP